MNTGNSPAAAGRARLGALSIAISGVLFLLYPLVRPYADETSIQGAEAMASPAWVAAHLFGMIGFILLSLGLLGLRVALRETSAEPLVSRAVVVTWIGAGLTLAYFGAEDFGLNAIGQRALDTQDLKLLVELTEAVRFNPIAITVFGAGLVSLAVGSILAAVAVWRSGILPRWSGVPIAIGFALFIPQFFGTPAMRIAHGVLITAGSLWLASALWRAQRR
ncbi:hypothetical protein [Streptosporangium lutulentum]|uniref:DUF4386 family protein n=1 Tax=Streptosporangium lutulentum TaxID=1461250 RepID=A0ABT9QKC8_9ACTN|nr:hypothetical protein [Streptosporangium lutulentum]MDP9847211.1 hypothetical protein [Streptosporangium lutulentum]